MRGQHTILLGNIPYTCNEEHHMYNLNLNHCFSMHYVLYIPFKCNTWICYGSMTNSHYCKPTFKILVYLTHNAQWIFLKCNLKEEKWLQYTLHLYYYYYYYLKKATQAVLMCSAWFSEQTAIISLDKIKWSFRPASTVYFVMQAAGF